MIRAVKRGKRTSSEMKERQLWAFLNQKSSKLCFTDVIYLHTILKALEWMPFLSLRWGTVTVKWSLWGYSLQVWVFWKWKHRGTVFFTLETWLLDKANPSCRLLEAVLWLKETDNAVKMWEHTNESGAAKLISECKCTKGVY